MVNGRIGGHRFCNPCISSNYGIFPDYGIPSKNSGIGVYGNIVFYGGVTLCFLKFFGHI